MCLIAQTVSKSHILLAGWDKVILNTSVTRDMHMNIDIDCSCVCVDCCVDYMSAGDIHLFSYIHFNILGGGVEQSKVRKAPKLGFSSFLDH